MASLNLYPGQSVSERLVGKARVGTGRVCLAFGKNWKCKRSLKLKGCRYWTYNVRGGGKGDDTIMYVRPASEEEDKVLEVLALLRSLQESIQDRDSMGRGEVKKT